jgi:hypothetical protein
MASRVLSFSEAIGVYQPLQLKNTKVCRFIDR